MKYINADKLKEAVKRRFPYLPYGGGLDLIDELSEEREDIVSKEVLLEELSKSNLDTKLTEWEQPNPLKVVIKGDGTEEYSKVIFQYFSSHTIKGLHDIYSFEQEAYYFIENNKLVFSLNLPEGYTEISLKEDWKIVTDNSKVNTYLLNRVEELEKELIDLKLKLKDLSK